jgi:peptidoglycan hydrolase CwlO-like protein
MLGKLVRRERRALWGSLSLVVAVAIGVTVFAASASREKLTLQARNEARLAAQTQLAPMLQTRDLQGTITGERADELATAIESEILSSGPVTSVRIYSEAGRVLYDADPEVVAVRPTYVRELVYEVAHGDPVSQVRGDDLQTYVPVWLEPGGPVAVAEMTQPYEPISSQATDSWYRLAMILGLVLLGTATLFVFSAQAASRVPDIAEVQMHPAFVEAQDARVKAEKHATATESALKELQAQFRSTLDELKAMEAMVQMTETATTHSEGEMQTLRDQLRDTAERLHKAELDNNALRERLSLRQSELDEHKSRVLELEQRTPSAEIEELRRRVDVAERRAVELEAEVERLQSELDHTADRFHMSKLTEALREFDNDEPGGEEDDIYEHPKVIFSARQAGSKVRGNGK